MSICLRCNAGFRCGMLENADQPCWCAALPLLPADGLPEPERPGCLCPSCLRDWIAERAADAGS